MSAEPAPAAWRPGTVPDAVVFDCDGLLLDTERCWTGAERAVFARYGKPFGEAEKRALLGSGMEAAARTLERLLDQPGRGLELAAEVLAALPAELAKGVDPLPGAVELLDGLRGRCPLGVASNSPGVLLRAVLAAAGVEGAFDAVVAADEVPRSKPAPDVYLAACRLLDASPTQAVALEDSPTGIAAARSAGMYVIGVPSLPDTALDADLVAGSLASPRVARVLGLG
jgi:HAD superfamily hydrolase (TIGR01509 family)